MTPDVLRIDHPDLLRRVEAALETGGILVFPTDTVYGIGGNPWDRGVLDRVRRLKERPVDRPFTLHLASVSGVEEYARLDDVARRRVERILPGPYTVLLPATDRAPASAVLDGVVGVRVPDHPFFERVLAAVGRPLFGTSVNRSGEPPLREIDDIIERFPSVDLVIDGSVGAGESSILDLTVDPPRLVRGTLPDGL
jgi:L-threonylcarbamoyladenylate synthase